MIKTAVIGAGSFGTALASIMAGNGLAVTLWGRSAEIVDAINKTGINSVYLPDMRLAAGVRATTELATAVADAELVVLATPSHGLRSVLAAAVPFLRTPTTLVCAVKGIEIDTLALMSEVIADVLGGRP